MICPICERAEMNHRSTYARCASCNYWSSEFVPDVASTAAPDVEYDLVSYERTRRANYLAILELLACRHKPGSRLLELGCADGLFLDMARERAGFAALGIEPNAKMIAGNKHHQDIRRGFFPAVLEGRSETFDVIALNCVFEHVPDVDSMLDAFARYLAPGGSVMLNIPVTTGFMFHAARALYRVGIRYPFERIWQKGFVSPHLHYFARGNLTQLLARHGFALVAETPLELFSLGGIYQRLSLDPNIRAVQRWIALAGLYAYYPVSKLAPDARAFVFTRAAEAV